MVQFVEELMERAKKLDKTIALAEGFDVRAAKAAEILTQNGVCKVVLIGNEQEIKKQFPDVNLDGVKFDDPKTSKHLEEYADTLYELRKAKGMTREQALSIVTNNNMFFACVALKRGDVDGVVGGAVFSSADVSRAAFQVIKAAPGISSVSSCFVMVPPEDFKYKKYPAYIFSDCAVIPYPTDAQLKDIVVAAADSAKKICHVEPKVAMLSFSTKGSAKHESIDKVQSAYNMVKAEYPDMLVDGELQLDASIVDSVAKQKAGDSPVAGQANVLVFPNLDAGNIGYKLAQRFGNCMAIGPIMQGLALPVNDLSRGCVAEDIAAVAAITALQSVKE
ncbi:MAG: phosphate acetyltransferase [Bacteroides sp.]|nr:phosphate acetyltransferase [Bacillota bacterium]MCM1393694.1 phosphate acetyltransferase [[Eubacterium] siraeum]MCM1456132.1 phosphate acetyltransferase [Bacteroides sp.]